MQLIEGYNGQQGWYGLAHSRPFINAPAANYLFDNLDALEAAKLIECRAERYWITAAGRDRLTALKKGLVASV